MVGDVLLAGTKQDDGTVTANESLRLTIHNLPRYMSFLLPYISPTEAKTENNGWCHFKEGVAGYPIPVLPCHGTGQMMINLHPYF